MMQANIRMHLIVGKYNYRYTYNYIIVLEVWIYLVTRIPAKVYRFLNFMHNDDCSQVTREPFPESVGDLYRHLV